MLQGTLADSLLSQLQGKSQVRNKTLSTCPANLKPGSHDRIVQPEPEVPNGISPPAYREAAESAQLTEDVTWPKALARWGSSSPCSSQ